jgi:hypothetical protein
VSLFASDETWPHEVQTNQPNTSATAAKRHAAGALTAWSARIAMLVETIPCSIICCFHQESAIAAG